MNILFFHSNGILPEKGGISRTTHNLAAYLRKQGHNVSFMGHRNLCRECFYDSKQEFIPLSIVNSFEEMVVYLNLYLRNNAIDIVINQNPFKKLYVDLIEASSKGIKCKIISCFHNTILTPIYNYAYQKEYLLRKRGLAFLFHLLRSRFVNKLLLEYYIRKNRGLYVNTIQKSDKVVLLCEGLKDELIKISGISDGNKYSVIPNMVPDIVLDEDVEKKNIVLWVGTFDNKVKRPDLALNVWARVCKSHNDWELHLIGDGPAFDEMQSLAQNLELTNVFFKGRTNPYPYYKESKIIMVTSTHESFSLVTVEAMSHKCVPIVFNSFPAARRIIKDNKTGCLIPAFSVDKFSKVLTTLMDEPMRLNTISEETYIASKNYSPNNIGILWSKLIMDL